ncbi:MAG: hypothetical protein HQK53_11625 [Oligoflexia bacterium]|nr:hypothetical protein [Oligoflexia bacterium]
MTETTVEQKRFQSPIPPGVSSKSFSNEQNKSSIEAQISGGLGARTLENTLAAGAAVAAAAPAAAVAEGAAPPPPAEGSYDRSTGAFAPPAGGFVDMKTGFYVPPPPGSSFDANTGVYIPPPSMGGVDPSTGQYIPPAGLKLNNDGNFVKSESAITTGAAATGGSAAGGDAKNAPAPAMGGSSGAAAPAAAAAAPIFSPGLMISTGGAAIEFLSPDKQYTASAVNNVVAMITTAVREAAAAAAATAKEAAGAGPGAPGTSTGTGAATGPILLPPGGLVLPPPQQMLGTAGTLQVVPPPSLNVEKLIETQNVQFSANQINTQATNISKAQSVNVRVIINVSE